jgi:hypothetical protein
MANNNLSFNGGNVGIGTTSPSNRLDVIRGTAGTMGRAVYETATFSYDSDTKLGIYYAGADGPSAGAAIMFAATNFTANSTYPGFEIQFRPSSSLASNYMRFNYTGRNATGTVTTPSQDLLTIFQTGDVGIGIGSARPSARLHVSSSTGAVLEADGFGTLGANALYVSSSGNVGVRYTNPQAPLAVSGSAAINSTSVYEPNTFSLDVNGGLIVKNTVGKAANITLINADPSIGGNNAFVVHTVGATLSNSFVKIQGYYGASVVGSTRILLNPEGGNVGINTMSASAALTVQGNISSSAAVYFKGLTSTTQTNVVGIDITTGQLFYQTTSSLIAGSAISASYSATASIATSASYAVTSSNTISASYAANGGVTQIVAGSNISLSPTNGTGVVTINATGGSSGGGTNTTASFSNSTTWTFNHNLNSQYVIVQAIDTSGNQIIPQNITLTSANTATITFPTAESGIAIASLGGVGVTAATASYVITYDTAWTSYTPVWTAGGSNPVIGNGTIQGYYKVVGKICFVRGNIAMGTTTTFGSGEWYISMPFTASNADAILMSANLLDNTTAWYNATVNGARAGFNYKAPIQYQAVGGTADSVTPTTPFTWTNSDRFIWNGSYEIA